MNSIKLNTQNKVFVVSFFAFIAVYVWTHFQNKPEEKNVARDQFESADTFIPAGHVLVPIEIENVDSVSGLIGAFALVDLYFRGLGGSQEMFLAAQKIKLIRAPLNPNQYAVLVTEKESVELLKLNPRFWVTLHNQKNTSHERGVLTAENKAPTQKTAEVKSEALPDKIKTQKKKTSKRAKVEDEVIIEYYDSKKARYL